MKSYSYKDYLTQFLKDPLATVSYWCSYATLASAIAIVGPAMITLKCKCNADDETMSWIVFCQLALAPVATLLATPLSQRISPHGMQLMASFLLPLCTISLAWANTVFLLAFVMSVMGIQLGLIENLVNTQLIIIHGDYSSFFLQTLYFLYGIGALLTQLIVDPFLKAVDHDCRGLNNNVDTITPFCIVASMQACVFVLVVVMIMKQGFVKRSSAGINPHGSPTAKGGGEKFSFNDWLTARMTLFFLAALMVFMLDGIQTEFAAYIYSYARSIDTGTNSEYSGYVGTIFWGMFTLGRLLAAGLSLCVCTSAILIVDMIGLLCGAIVVVCGHHDMNAIYVGSALFGLSLSNTVPSVLALTQEYATLTGWSTAFIVVFAASGEALLPLIIQNLIALKTDLSTGFPLANLVVVVIIIILFIIFMITAWRKSTELQRHQHHQEPIEVKD